MKYNYQIEKELFSKARWSVENNSFRKLIMVWEITSSQLDNYGY